MTCLLCTTPLSGGIDTTGEGYCLICHLERSLVEMDCNRLMETIHDGVPDDVAERLAWRMLFGDEPSVPSLALPLFEEAPHA